MLVNDKMRLFLLRDSDFDTIFSEYVAASMYKWRAFYTMRVNFPLFMIF